MTQLIETYKIEITLNHDAVDSAVYSGALDLKKCLSEAWSGIGSLVELWPDRRGRLQLLDGGIDVRWERSGLDEVPELGGGDN